MLLTSHSYKPALQQCLVYPEQFFKKNPNRFILIKKKTRYVTDENDTHIFVFII